MTDLVKPDDQALDPVTAQQSRILNMIRDEIPEYHPLLALARLSQHEDAEIRDQITCHTVIAKYTEREFKAVEVKGNIGVDFGTLSIEYEGNKNDLPKVVNEVEEKEGEEVTSAPRSADIIEGIFTREPAKPEE